MINIVPIINERLTSVRYSIVSEGDIINGVVPKTTLLLEKNGTTMYFDFIFNNYSDLRR